MRQFDGPSRRRVTHVSKLSKPVIASPTGVIAEPIISSPTFVYQPTKPKKFRQYRNWALMIGGGIIAAALIYLGVHALLATHRIITRNSTGGAPALAGNINPTKLRGEGDGRINILLLGIGGPGHQAPNLSDTMMVMSIDPRTKDVAMLSVPRDLWVQIPGYGYAKINAANAYGEMYGYTGGGAALAKKTIEKVLDIPIHYFVRADFTGFRQAIDAVGGVDVVVDKALYDPFYPCDSENGGYCLFSVKAGRQHMNGTIALRYSRSRETTSDFDRAARQQKVLVALREKALSLSVLSNPTKLTGLIDAVGGHVKTDLQLGEIKKLANMAKDIDTTKIIQKVLDTSPDGFLVNGDIGGAYVELPRTGNFDEIRQYVHSIFIDSYLKDENATVEVQNASGRSGLATTVSTMLKSYNYNVVGATTSPTIKPVTVIYDYSGGKKPYTINYLERRFGVKAQRANPVASDPEVRIVLGTDYKTSQ